MQIETATEQSQAYKKYQNRFIRVGIQSQQCNEQPITPDILDHECHQIPEDQLQYDGKFSHFIDSINPGNYQTYASLKNVQKIQASTGIQGQSRSPNHISGLKLEYYNHPSPSTIGQWMNELDNNDGLELSQDEDVCSLSIWLTPMGVSTECPGLEVGQVAAIHIETTHSRSVTFRSPEFHTIPPQKLYHQYSSASDETLTAISWILNASSDCIRAVVSASTDQRTQITVPKPEPPFDLVRKLYFEAQRNDDGTNGCGRETITTAEAYFRDRAIIGLVFVYTSGRRASIGDFSNFDFDTHTYTINTRQNVHFAPDTRIVGLSTAASHPDLLELEFEVVEQNRYNEQQQSQYTTNKKLKLSSINSPHDGHGNIGCDWRDIWCKDGPSAEIQQQQRLSINDRVYKPPGESAKLVGTYVGCQDFSCIGAIYEPESEPGSNIPVSSIRYGMGS